MSAAVVQAVYAAGNSVAITSAAGNTLVVFGFIQAISGSYTACGDGGSDTFVQRQLDTSTGLHCTIYDSIASSGGTKTVTLTHGGTVSSSIIYVVEVSGIVAYGTGGTGANSTGVPTTASFTPAAGDFIVAGASAVTAAFTAMTAGTGYTLQRTDAWGVGAVQAAAIEYLLSSTGSAQTATMNPSQSVSWAIEAAAYTQSATATAKDGTLPMMGV